MHFIIKFEFSASNNFLNYLLSSSFLYFTIYIFVSNYIQAIRYLVSGGAKKKKKNVLHFLFSSKNFYKYRSCKLRKKKSMAGNLISRIKKKKTPCILVFVLSRLLNLFYFFIFIYFNKMPNFRCISRTFRSLIFSFPLTVNKICYW